jgi:hypothetical protein
MPITNLGLSYRPVCYLKHDVSETEYLSPFFKGNLLKWTQQKKLFSAPGPEIGAQRCFRKVLF